jgi:hypothetical protein
MLLLSQKQICIYSNRITPGLRLTVRSRSENHDEKNKAEAQPGGTLETNRS